MLLEVKNLGKRFDGFWGLKKLDLQIEADEVRAIIGPNGAGKSTLFNLLVGRYKPTEGDIFYNGSSIVKLSPDARARLGIAIKFQITTVFETLKVSDNIYISLYGSGSSVKGLFKNSSSGAKQKADEILNLIGLKHKSEEEVSTLVHGERQWLEIGMALAMNPTILLLDEPTSGMGHDETRRTAELINSLKGSYTIVVIEHDMEFVRSVADKITVLDGGTFLTEGNYEEIRSDDRVINAYLGRGREDDAS